jgi:protein-tyrosine-phosphatase
LGRGDSSLRERVIALNLQSLDLTDAREVDDPAGGDQDVYHACAAQIMDHLERLIERC